MVAGSQQSSGAMAYDSETADLGPGGVAQSGKELWSQPNKFARPPRIQIKGSSVTVHGYQEFRISPEKIKPLPIDEPLLRKRKLVQVFFEPEFLTGKTMLDIGANGGFFSLWACQNGASQVVSLDMDKEYLELIHKAQTALGWKQIRPINEKVQNWNEPADMVLAFAMIHWLYSCTANYGSLDAVVGKLAGLSRSVLLTEWVAPEDTAIRSFKHTEWNPQVDKSGYSLEAFEAAMCKHFRKVEVIGPVSPTRVLYVGYRHFHEVTLHPALPLLGPVEQVISSRFLCECEKTKYYSRVYLDAAADRILKQASLSMAVHEAGILNRLTGACFPKVISAEQREGYSVLVMERIQGVGLAECRAAVAANPTRLRAFFEEALAMLRQLAAASVRHRDIRLENIMVRDGHPVLIDFGWAEKMDEPYLNPGGLGGLERIPDGPTCDTYSLGRVFEQIIPLNSKLFAPLLQVMLDPNLARSVPSSGLEEVLKSLELPETWDVPLVFPVPRRSSARHGEALVKTGTVSAECARFWKRCRRLYQRIFGS
jgi:hypothetical protein